MSEQPQKPRTIPVNDQSPNPVKMVNGEMIDLYAKKDKIQARSIDGFFQNIRIITIWVTMAIYLILPWVTWDGRQALLFDLPNRHFYIFGWTFLPQDFFFLSWMLIMAAFGLFSLTVIAGRVYCGYMCPQTVWTKIFMIIERVTEGERHVRIRMDKAPMSLEKFTRRTLKHTGWILVSLVTAITFVSYFTPARVLTEEILTFTLGFWEMFWILFFVVMTYMNAGWMREQVCLFMCPYGRFQSVMIDKDSLIISYDKKRGESRGKRKRGADYKAEGLGDCIDCELCVQVCPTGIDIRDGLQFECIQCAACIDACDSVMDQMGYERGLVRYTTENLLENGGKYQFLRPRLIGYVTVMSIVATVFLVTLSMRTPLEVETLRDRNQLFRENNDGMIENVYQLKVLNKSQKTEQYVVNIEGAPQVSMEEAIVMNIEPGEQVTVPVTLVADPADLKERKYKIVFNVQSKLHPDIHRKSESRFLAPAP